MDALSLAAFEERASAAERRLEQLEQLLQAGARDGQSSVDSTALAEIMELLMKAREQSYKEAEERDKLKYQIKHLKRALDEQDKVISELKSKVKA